MRDVAKLRAWRSTRSRAVGFVPTMGALHAGHLALVREARASCEHVVTSVFVNPTQFGPHEDFAKYPRSLDDDVRMAVAAGSDVIFAPEAAEIFANDTTRVRVSGVSEGWEGAIRPGHFEGVATVVLKLFEIVRPEVAFFGLKDLQQCAVLDTMVRDLFLPVALRFVETVRDERGLALSSRNALLSHAGLARAARFAETVLTLARRLGDGDGSQDAESILGVGRSDLAGIADHVDYLTLLSFPTMMATHTLGGANRLVAAVRIEGVRLLDNRPVPLP